MLKLSELKKQWAFLLWIVIFILVLIVGLGGELIAIRWGYQWHFWLYWEVAALVSTILFNVLFYILGFFLPPRMFLLLRPQSLIGVVVLLELFSIAGLVYATWISLRGKSCSLQLSSILITVICLATIDWVMARYCNNSDVSQDFQSSVALNDRPTLVAFSVLLIFSLIYSSSHSLTNTYDDNFRAFVGGAIAFQMIASNWTLAIIFRKPGQLFLNESARKSAADELNAASESS